MLRFTVSGIPIPFDDEGNELCLLYLKYGRCRYRKKCKKSHKALFPPLPTAEEPPCCPPLPLSPPPHTTEDQQPSPECFQLTDNLPTTSSTFCTTVPITSPPLEVFSNQPSNLSGATSLNSFDSVPCKAKETQLTVSGAVLGINSHPVTGTGAGDVCLNRISDDVEQMSFTEHEMEMVLKVEQETKDKKLQRILSKVQRRKTRFGHIFKAQTIGYQSGVDKMFQDAGAYFSKQLCKLELKKSPTNKVEKHLLKLMKKVHWKINQSLLNKLKESPPIYLLNVDLLKVNFTRIKPYVYLLIQECFSAGHMISTSSRLPSLFIVLVSETLLAQIEHKELLPLDAEKKLCSWGAEPVMVRKCIKELWSTIHRSSLAPTGVASEVMRCERGVRQRNLNFLDYAFACSLAAGHAKAGVVEKELRTVKVSKAVRQGLKSTKDRQVPNRNRGKREKWFSQRFRNTQNRTPLNLANLRVPEKDLDVYVKEDNSICEFSKEKFAEICAKPSIDSTECGSESKEFGGKLNKHKPREFADDSRVTLSQRKRKRSRKFKGMTRDERLKFEAKFKRVLEVQLGKTVSKHL